MSFLLMIFYWVGIPLLILLATGWALHQAQIEKQKKWIFAVTAVVLLGLLWAAGGEKAMVDAQVRKLCAQDGGIRVYETVKLPKELADKYGGIRIPEEEEFKPSDEYYYKSDHHSYMKGKLEMWRSHYRVYRSVDNKLLGEAVSYARRGGDLPGPWHESSFGCPINSDISDLKKKVFSKAD